MKIIIDIILLGYAWNFTIGLVIMLHLRKPKWWWLLIPYLFIYHALKEE